MSYAGLDVGTTGCKCTVFSEEGKTLASAYAEYQNTGRFPGYGIDPVAITEKVKEVLKRVTADCLEDPVKAIAVSSFGEAFVPIAENGEVLGGAMQYTDPRGALQTSQLEAKLGSEQIFRLTGHRPHSMYSLGKMMWLRDNEPQIFSKAHKLLLIEDFIIYILTGETVTDYSLASRTMAFDISGMKWSDTVLNAAEIPKEKLASPIPSGTPAGVIRTNICRQTGLLPGTLVATGAHDQVCAALGAGIFEAGKAVNGMGTVDCVTPVFKGPLTDSAMFDGSYACVPYVTEGLYVTYAFSFTGGALLKWFRDSFTDSDELKRAKKLGLSIYSLLDKESAGPPTGLLVMPHFSGAATPFMDTASKGAITGLSLDTSRRTLYRALMEGVAYEMRLNIDFLEKSGIKTERLTAVGGGAVSSLWLQIKADVLDRPVYALDISEAGTAGAALLAGKAAGMFDDLSDAQQRMVSIKREYYPVESNRDIYYNYYLKYLKLYHAMKEVWS